jgi:hypothetical protein
MAGGEEEEDYLYINLLTNPERYTGYKVCVRARARQQADCARGGSPSGLGPRRQPGARREPGRAAHAVPARAAPRWRPRSLFRASAGPLPKGSTVSQARPPSPLPNRPQGEHAHRIWSEIYKTIDCAKAAAGECAEARVFYRLISGMHASISTHLTAYWLIDEDKGVWGPNMEEFQ